MSETTKETELAVQISHNEAGAADQGQSDEQKIAHRQGDEYEQKTSTRHVGAFIWVHRVDNVDVIAQKFTATFRLTLGWAGTGDDYADYAEYKAKGKEYRPAYDPMKDFEFVNANSIDTEELIECAVVTEGDKDVYGCEILKCMSKYVICASYEIRGEFYERFHLEHFPFDCQDLQIKFRALHEPNDKLWVVPGFYRYKKMKQGGFDFGALEPDGCNLTEYKLEKFLVESKNEGYDSGYAYSSINFRIKLARKWWTYVFKIIFFIFIITLFTFLVYSMDDGAGGKYGLLLTLLLTNVAFQFVIGTYIPNLPYLTILDEYAIGSVVFIFLVMAQIFIFELAEIDQDGDEAQIVAIVIGCLFGIKQIYFLVKGCMARKYETKKLDMDGFDYRNKPAYRHNGAANARVRAMYIERECVDERLKDQVMENISGDLDHPSFKGIKEE